MDLQEAVDGEPGCEYQGGRERSTVATVPVRRAFAWTRALISEFRIPALVHTCTNAEY